MKWIAPAFVLLIASFQASGNSAALCRESVSPAFSWVAKNINGAKPDSGSVVKLEGACTINGSPAIAQVLGGLWALNPMLARNMIFGIWTSGPGKHFFFDLTCFGNGSKASLLEVTGFGVPIFQPYSVVSQLAFSESNDEVIVSSQEQQFFHIKFLPQSLSVSAKWKLQDGSIQTFECPTLIPIH